MKKKLLTLFTFVLLALLPFTFTNIYPQDVFEVPEVSTENSYYLDGFRTATFWAHSKTLPALINKQAPNQNLKPNSVIEIISTKEWVILGATVEEQKNIIATEYMNNKALWFDDNLTFTFKAKEEISVQINPLGAITLQQNAKASLALLQQNLIRTCARIQEQSWRVEIAIHKSLLVSDTKTFSLNITAEKQARGYEPYHKSELETKINITALQNGDKPLFVALRQAFPNLTLVQTNFQTKIPEMIEDWAKIPSYPLTLNTGHNASDANFKPTNVQVAVTNEEIAIRIENFEENIDDFLKNENLITEDADEIFLTPDGYAYAEVTVTPDGKMSCHRGVTGGRRAQQLPVPEWATTKIETTKNSWIVVYKAKIAGMMGFAGAPTTLTPSNYPWQIQIIRNRTARIQLNQRAQESNLAVTNSGTAHCPARFAKIAFTNEQVKPIEESTSLLPNIFSNEDAIQKQISNSFNVWFKDQKAQYQKKSNEVIANIHTATDWQVFKKEMLAKITYALFPNDKGSLPKKTPTKAIETYTIEKDNVVVKGVIFKSRKNVPVTTTLYLPKDYQTRKQMPAMIMIPAHHTARNAVDLYDLAKNLVDQGCLAIAVDTLGSGERGIAARWNHKNHQRNLIGSQLILANETILGWSVADILSTVDYLYEREDIDRTKLALIGGVAGGGDVTAVAAILDERITVSIPFNYSHQNIAESWYDLTRSFPLAFTDGVSPAIILALTAPRKLIMAQEFDWVEPQEKTYAFLTTVFEYYGSKENLSFMHGGPNTHATSYSPIHRVPVYKILNKWWGLRLPETRGNEKNLRLKDGDLEVTPYQAGANFIKQNFSRKAFEYNGTSLYTEPNFLADNLSQQLRKTFSNKYKKQSAQSALQELFTNTDAFETSAQTSEEKTEKYHLEKIRLALEPKLSNGFELMAGVWLFINPNQKEAQKPLILCLSQEGKTIFYNERKSDIETFLEQGYAVALTDVRGTGETELDSFRLPESITATISYNLWQMQTNLLSLRIKDTKTILKTLCDRPDIDRQNIILWGEGFTEPNGKEGETFKFEETGFRQADAAGKRLVEPLGALLAMITPTLLPNDYKVTKVITRGGLISYQSILEDFYYYVPADILVPSILTKIDIPDIATLLHQKQIHLYSEDMRDAKNRVVSEKTVKNLYPSIKFYHEQTTRSLIETLLKVK